LRNILKLSELMDAIGVPLFYNYDYQRTIRRCRVFICPVSIQQLFGSSKGQQFLNRFIQADMSEAEKLFIES